MGTAVLALALSVVTRMQSRATPEITMNLPSILRISGTSLDVFIQPSFSVPREYESLARISAVHLDFARAYPPPDEVPEFFWVDSGGFGELGGDAFGWTYAADPAPFIVGHEEPQRPTIRFNTEQQLIGPGRWTGTVTAYRGSGQEPLVQRFCVLVDEGDMADYPSLGPRGFIEFRNDIPNSPTSCYWRPDAW